MENVQFVTGHVIDEHSEFGDVQEVAAGFGHDSTEWIAWFVIHVESLCTPGLGLLRFKDDFGWEKLNEGLVTPHETLVGFG